MLLPFPLCGPFIELFSFPVGWASCSHLTGWPETLSVIDGGASIISSVTSCSTAKTPWLKCQLSSGQPFFGLHHKVTKPVLSFSAPFVPTLAPGPTELCCTFSYPPVSPQMCVWPRPTPGGECGECGQQAPSPSRSVSLCFT